VEDCSMQYRSSKREAALSELGSAPRLGIDVDADVAISNDLHKYLMQKDTISFWKSWQSKFCKQKQSPVIDGSCDGRVIVEKFADYFKSVCSTDPSVSESRESIKQSIADYTSQHAQCTLFSVETVDKCLKSMKLVKAAGLHGIEIEHLLYAHPLLIVMLCVLFNIMLIHGVVPQMFGNGVIVPIVKNKNGDITSLDNYKGITVSTCLSKLFESCILYSYEDHFRSSHHYSLASSGIWDVVMLFFFLGL